MRKSIFKPVELHDLTKQNQVELEPPRFGDEEEEVEVYEGPTADELREEATLFKRRWAEEKRQLEANKENEADEILKNAQEQSGAIDESARARAAAIEQEARQREERIIEEAREDARRIIADAEAQRDRIHAEAAEDGRKEGYEAGYEASQDEAKRLVDRVHRLINGIVQRRIDIVDELETQLIDLVILIAKKVIRVVSESQKNVIIYNVLEALKKVKNKSRITIRVNNEDMELTTSHEKDFIAMVEGLEALTVVEDRSIERGGCIVETDFGEIDARISAQLREVEERVLELRPIKHSVLRTDFDDEPEL